MRKVSDKLRRILMAVLAIVFCVSAVIFGKSLLEYRKGDEIYESAMEFVEETDVTAAPETEGEEEKEEKKQQNAPVSTVKRTYANVDFAGLQAINEDVIGWIQILGTQVDYPLLDADDNKYYLNHTYDHRRSSYGSIFIEPRNKPDLSEDHLVIYGHNMVNKSMFGSLLHYKQQSYANNHNTITICMPGKDLTYRVFSAYTAHVDSATYRMSFSSDASFQEMISHMKDNSMIHSDVTPKMGDQILTLSTCTPAGAKNYRFVVNAVLVSGNRSAAAVQENPAVLEEKEIEESKPVAEEPPEEYTVIQEVADEPVAAEEITIDVQTVDTGSE